MTLSTAAVRRKQRIYTDSLSKYGQIYTNIHTYTHQSMNLLLLNIVMITYCKQLLTLGL